MRRQAVLVGVSAVLSVAVGVAVNQILNGGVWSWPWIVASVALTVVSAAAADRLAASADGGKGVGPVLWPSVAGPGGVPKRLVEVAPADLGVHRSRFGADGDSLYVPRDADEIVNAAVADGERRVLIVQGPRLAGTTSTLAQAAQLHLPDHRVAWFVDDPRISLTDMIGHAARWAGEGDGAGLGVVVWLERLTPGRFTELARLPPGALAERVWVLATVDVGELEELRDSDQCDRLLEQMAVRVTVGVISSGEREELGGLEVYAGLRPLLEEGTDLLMGRVMVSFDQIRSALTPGRDEESTSRIAVLRAVTDWQRARLPRLLTREILDHLYNTYHRDLTDQGSSAPVSAGDYTRALEWATSAGPDRPRLIDLQKVSGGKRYAPHPLLGVIADDRGEQVAWAVADPLWAYADRFFEGDQRRDIGRTALTRDAYRAAARLLDHTDCRIDPADLLRIAVGFLSNGDLDSARTWYLKVIATDHPDHTLVAMLDLGVLEYGQGDVERARHWWLQAIAAGHPNHTPAAMVSLGVLAKEQGDVEQARQWWLEAATTSHPDRAPQVMLDLGLLEYGQGDVERARHWWLQAIAAGHLNYAPAAMVGLGVLENDQGTVGQARYWYGLAIATGHRDEAPRAMVNLGGLERDQGDVGQTRRWWREAIATGHADHAPQAMVSLGFLEVDQGDVGQARRWWREAIATGHADRATEATFGLALLEKAQGEWDQARYWLRETVTTGHADHAPRAMVSLGALEHDQGTVGQARYWYGLAIATGHRDEAPRAMVNLGLLEVEERRWDQARRWWREAIATGHRDEAPRAMVNLGRLERGQGDVGQARHWWREAIATGHPTEAVHAGRELGALDRREDEQRRAEHFGRYGYQAYADPDLMRTPSTAIEQPEHRSRDGEPENDDATPPPS